MLCSLPFYFRHFHNISDQVLSVSINHFRGVPPNLSPSECFKIIAQTKKLWVYGSMAFFKELKKMS
jgi:hypothetical protein